MHVTDTEALEWEATLSSREGKVYRKLIREGEILPGVNYYIRMTKFTSEEGPFQAPRHQHDFEQIRYCMAGEQSFGDGFVSRTGSLSYYPAGTEYGPEYIEDAEQLLIQWGPTFVSKTDNDAAILRMKERGEFRGGMYEYVDENGGLQRVDSLQAIWEEAFGRPLVIPPRRYAQMVLVDTDAFEWTPGESEHLQHRRVGRFGADDLALDVVQWSNNGTLDLAAERTSLLFVLSGEIEIGGIRHGKGTTVFSDFGDRDAIIGIAGAEILRVGFPIQLAVLA
ncbi:hypothetical protein ABH922_005455 [Rhodococcus sp. 27YEA15]|uniref:hypothetical protein n=1 Tax=Rhodococcus sp. 27YEA15 TaxID=3156259 RepID=UPI003C7EC97A